MLSVSVLGLGLHTEHGFLGLPVVQVFTSGVVWRSCRVEGLGFFRDF